MIGIRRFCSEIEFDRAFVVMMPDSEAHRLAREFSGNDLAGASTGLTPNQNPRELVAAYSDDLLVALSFVSAETEQKVERFRRSRAHGDILPKEQADWLATRARFKNMVDEIKRRGKPAG
jgi:hypothetical protein